MSLSVTEQSLFAGLKNTLEVSRAETRDYNSFYEGTHKLVHLGLAIPPELKRFTVWLAWPRLVVDSLERRLDITGFRMPGAVAADTGLWETWQYNNMNERQTFVHTDALALARSYACVGSNEEEPEHPLITIESPEEMVAVRDPRTHRVSSALRLYGGQGANPDSRATLYLPNRTRWLILDEGEWVDEFDPDEHNLGTVPVVPFVNRNRATRLQGSILEGTSEMRDIIPVAESASRAMTNMQLTQETLAAPQRGVLGATQGDFMDEEGNPLSAWDSYFGAVWAISDKDAKTFQFDAADMTNFDTALNVYARQVSALGSLPVEYLGLNTDNPPSADGQRAGETRLIKLAERKQTSFGHSYESLMRLVVRFRDGEWSADGRRMQALWRDAGTPTMAQVTDSVVKEFQSGLTDWETAQETLGRSPETIARMKERRQRELQGELAFGVQQVAEEV